MSGLELDPAVLRRRLHHLAVAVDRLEKYRNVPLEQLAAKEDADWAVLHGLQLATQAVLDITSHIVAASGGPMPDTYAGNLVALEQLGVLPPAFLERIAGIAGFRNILVRGYLDVDLRLVHRLLNERLDDFRAFGLHVEGYLAGSP